MRSGHAEAQVMFEEIGRHLGLSPSRTWCHAHQTDGVWLARQASGRDLPLVALEVVVTESPKSIRGSVRTLESVSPALGILLLQEEEIRRGLVKNGASGKEVDRRLARTRAEITAEMRASRQRLEAWTFARLRRRYEVVTGRAWTFPPARERGRALKAQTAERKNSRWKEQSCVC